MAEGTCSEAECSKRAHSRGLCSTCYGRAWRNGTLPQKEPNPQSGKRHSLSGIDPDKRTGLCSICGPVRVKLRNTRSAECWTVYRRRKTRYTSQVERTPSPHAGSHWKSPEAKRRDLLKRSFNLTMDDYEQMLAEQGDACAICGHRPDGRNLAVDHDHSCCPRGRSCGRCVRGLLCRSCNLALGYLHDDPERLAAAIDYLAKYAARLALVS